MLRKNGLWQRRARTLEELCGVNFKVQTETGNVVHVRVDSAYLLAPDDDIPQHVGSPAKTRGIDNGAQSQIVDLWSEQVICPGQAVELLGLVEESTDPEGVRATVRSPPVLLTLRAPPGLPLLVREVHLDASLEG